VISSSPMAKKLKYAFDRVVKPFLPLVIASMVFGLGLGIANNFGSYAQAYSVYNKLETFTEVLSLIENYYVEEKTSDDLIVGAIKGMIRTLDPHSSYMDIETFQSRREDTQGKFGGLGIEITLLDSYVTIVAPIEDTPAERLGLVSGDQIMKIDGKSTKDMDLYAAVKLMRGHVGTKVTLTIFRESTKKTFDVTIVRALIKVTSVKSGMIDNDIGYIRITSFSQDTARDVKKALDGMTKKHFRRLVLDLRNNPGGLLKQAVDVSDLFIGGNQTIVSTRGRSVDQNTKFRSHNWGGYYNFPIVVLINAGSASASEIVSGALQDLKRAVIVGERSFGKGSVQTIKQLSDGSGLTLTTAHYFTPSGKLIHGIGIEPDVPVKLIIKTENGDKIELPEPIREKQLMRHFKGERDLNRDRKIPENKNLKNIKPRKRTRADLKKVRKLFNLEKDNQLQKAIEVLKKQTGPRVTKASLKKLLGSVSL